MFKYIKGAWNVICSRCDIQFKSYECTTDDYIRGLVVCKACKDRYPELEYPTRIPRKEMAPVPFSNPRPATDTFQRFNYTWGNMLQPWEYYTENWEDY